MTEITEILYAWQKGVSERKIVKLTGTSRNTIRKIIQKAIKLGLAREPCEESTLLRVSGDIERQLQNYPQPTRPTAQQQLKAYHDLIEAWWKEPYMTMRQVWRLLLEKDPSLRVSESSCQRYIKQCFPVEKKKSVIVLHTPPAQQAQVDFGYVGMMKEASTGKMRRAYAFVMTLSYSRHRFVRFVFKQDTATWITCHIEAFKFFGGVPQTVLLDNLKAGVVKADRYDPIVNRSYAECARYYGFVVDPAKVRTPTHKGKVERSIPLVRQQVIAGRGYASIDKANAYARHWCANEIAHHVTRTTGETPHQRFIRDEQQALRALPDLPYEVSIWQESQVGQDQHITFQGSFYSLPAAYINKRVWIKATPNLLMIYDQGQLIKTYRRALRQGLWCTDPSDLPESSRHYLDQTPGVCLTRAQAIGEATYQVIYEVLERMSTSRLRKAQGILRLAERHSPQRLEQACAYTLSFGPTTFKALKSIIQHNLDQVQPSTEPSVDPEQLKQGAFLRDPSEFFTPTL